MGRLVTVAHVAHGSIVRDDALTWRESITAVEADVLRAHELYRERQCFLLPTLL